MREVVFGSAGFLAIGQRLEGAHGGPQQTAEHYWLSADGVNWEPVDPPGEVGVYWEMLYSTPDGDYVLLGYQADAAEFGTIRVAMRSSDGHNWESFETGLPPDYFGVSLDQGALGYLLAGYQSDANTAKLWLSADGLNWEQVYEFDQTAGNVNLDDVGAGAEGFVVFGSRSLANDDYARFALASGDGLDWIESEAPFGEADQAFRHNVFVTPSGPDWVASTMRGGQERADFWFSVDGLNWERTGSIENVLINAIDDPVLFSLFGVLYFSTGGEALPGGGAGVWSSADNGLTWRAEELGQAVAGDGATDRDVVVLTGSTATEGGSTGHIWRRRAAAQP